MASIFFRNKRIVASTILFFLLETGGCATTSVVTNWDDLPKHNPILVTTKNGLQYRFDQWRFERNGSLVGLIKRRAYAIPADSISEIATIDETNQKLAETSVIVVGSVAGAVLLFYVVWTMNSLPFSH